MLVWSHLLWWEDEIQVQEVQCTLMQKQFHWHEIWKTNQKTIMLKKRQKKKTDIRLVRYYRLKVRL